MEAPLSLNSSQEAQKVLVCMTIDIGDGRQGYLEVYEGDDTLDLVEAFCEEYELPDEKKERLAVLIENYRAKALEQPSYSEVTTQRPLSQASRKTQHSNFGEELYNREMRHRDEQQMRHLHQRKVEQEVKQKSHTFKPSINESSSLLSPRNIERTEDLLLRAADERRGRLESLSSEVISKKFEECTFSPKINKFSSRIEQLKHPHGPRFEKLYKEAAQRKSRQELLSEKASVYELSFKPNTSSSKWLQPNESKEAQLDRLYNSKKKFEEQMSDVRKSLEQQETSLFSPSTGRAPRAPVRITQRNADHKAVGSYLYELREQKKTLTQIVWKEVEAAQLEKNSVRANSQSNRMYELFCLKHYERIFKILDSDRDGVISADKINLDGIEDPAVEIMKPIFEELQAVGESMSFMDFVEKLHYIMSTLSLHDRSHILKRHKQANFDCEMKVTFPQSYISKRSEELASRYRAATPGQIYERQLQAKHV